MSDNIHWQGFTALRVSPWIESNPKEHRVNPPRLQHSHLPGFDQVRKVENRRTRGPDPSLTVGKFLHESRATRLVPFLYCTRSGVLPYCLNRCHKPTQSPNSPKTGGWNSMKASRKVVRVYVCVASVPSLNTRGVPVPENGWMLYQHSFVVCCFTCITE